MTITDWPLDQPAPPPPPRAPLTEPARVHGWHPCTHGCGDGFRCPTCGHYRHDAHPAAGYRCRRCIDTTQFLDRCTQLDVDTDETEHLITYIATAIHIDHKRRPRRQRKRTRKETR